jgi:hypothetical protein
MPKKRAVIDWNSLVIMEFLSLFKISSWSQLRDKLITPEFIAKENILHRYQELHILDKIKELTTLRKIIDVGDDPLELLKAIATQNGFTAQKYYKYKQTRIPHAYYFTSEQEYDDPPTDEIPLGSNMGGTIAPRE